MSLRISGVVLAAVGFGLAAAGVATIVGQDRAVRTFVPVPGVVLECHARSRKHHTENGPTDYWVDARFSYSVRGVRHESTRLAPTSGAGQTYESWRWIAQHYPRGAHVTVYVDPADADSAFLIREFSTRPYWGTLALLAVGLFGVIRAIRADGEGSPSMRTLPATHDDSGGTWLRPRRSLAEWAGKPLAAFGVIGGASVALGTHYLLRATPHSWPGAAFVLVCAAVTAWTARLAWRPWLMWRAIRGVRLAVDRVPMRRGEPATVRVEVAARRAVRLWSVRGRLACVEHSLRRLGAGSWSEHTRDQWTQSFTLSEGGRVGAGETLAGSAAITVPADQPATSGGKFPYVAWEVRVSVNLGVKVGCEQAFAVDVS